MKFKKLRTILYICLTSSLLLNACAQSNIKKGQDYPVNSLENLNKPYVLLVSIDGFRHDYVEKYKPPFLSKFTKNTARLKGLMPVFPSKTFVNHYSIATGMYADNHGIIDNYFYSKKLKKEFTLQDQETVRDHRFYSGVPIWNLATQQGMVSSAYFWVGSEAKINNLYPDYYTNYDHNRAPKKSIDEALSLFNLPEKVRPHFSTLYFHLVDSAHHRNEQHSDKAIQSVLEIDKALEYLHKKIQKLNLVNFNLIIVSDHGMTKVSKKSKSYIEDYFITKKDKEVLAKFDIKGKSPILNFYYNGSNENKKKHINFIFNHLSKFKKSFTVYKKDEFPKKLNFGNHHHIGDLYLAANMGEFLGRKGQRFSVGNHGYKVKPGNDMNGIFYASGPQFKKNKELGYIENIHVYPLIAEILGLKINHKIDGKLEQLSPLLKK